MATLVCMSFRKLPDLKGYEHIAIALLNHGKPVAILPGAGGWGWGMPIVVDWQSSHNQLHSKPKITLFFHGLVFDAEFF